MNNSSMLALAKKRNLPTFLLTIVKHKTEKGGDAVAQFFLTEDQARVITANINSKDSFIVFGDGSFYPKRGASLERMTPSQIRRKIFLPDTPDELEQQHNAEIAQEAAITQWISKTRRVFLKWLRKPIRFAKKLWQQAVFQGNQLKSKIRICCWHGTQTGRKNTKIAQKTDCDKNASRFSKKVLDSKSKTC